MKNLMCFFILLHGTNTFAQEKENAPENIIKASIGNWEIGINYERLIKNKHGFSSISCEFAVNPFGRENIDYENYQDRGYSFNSGFNGPVNTYVSHQEAYSYAYLHPKFKCFLGGSALKGLYFSGSLFFVQSIIKQQYYYGEYEPGTSKILYEDSYTINKKNLTVHGGASLGYNFIFWNILNIEPSIEMLSNPLNDIFSRQKMMGNEFRIVHTDQSSIAYPNVYPKIAVGWVF